MKRVVLCLGCGFTTTHLARNFTGEFDVRFLTRNPDRLRAAGLTGYDGTMDRPLLIVDSAPPDPSAPDVLPYQDICAGLTGQGALYLHISSTSVYGGADSLSTDIRTIDEGTPPDPDGPGGERRLTRERDVQKAYPGAWVLRAGGIYGPGRSLVESFQSGDFRRVSSANRIVSRIHVHDLCRLALAVVDYQGASGIPGRIVNAVDESPAANDEVFSFLETLLGIRVPGDWRNLPPTGRRVESRYAESMLGAYSFPDFRAGFSAIALAKRK